MIDPIIHSAPCAAWQQDDGDAILEISGDWKRDGPSVDVAGTAPTRFPTRYRVEKLGNTCRDSVGFHPMGVFLKIALAARLLNSYRLKNS